MLCAWKDALLTCDGVTHRVASMVFWGWVSLSPYSGTVSYFCSSVDHGITTQLTSVLKDTHASVTNGFC